MKESQPYALGEPLGAGSPQANLHPNGFAADGPPASTAADEAPEDEVLDEDAPEDDDPEEDADAPAPELDVDPDDAPEGEPLPDEDPVSPGGGAAPSASEARVLVDPLAGAPLEALHATMSRVDAIAVARDASEARRSRERGACMPAPAGEFRG
jgi:hypothetical protein